MDTFAAMVRTKWHVCDFAPMGTFPFSEPIILYLSVVPLTCDEAVSLVPDPAVVQWIW